MPKIHKNQPNPHKIFIWSH